MHASRLLCYFLFILKMKNKIAEHEKMKLGLSTQPSVEECLACLSKWKPIADTLQILLSILRLLFSTNYATYGKLGSS